MATGDLAANRDLDLDLTSAPALAGAPERLFVAALGEPQLARLGRIVPSITVSVVVHAVLAVVFVVLWRSMVHDLTAPEPISVEIVNSIPGEARKTAAPETKPVDVAPEAEAPAAAPAPPVPPAPDPLPMPQAAPAPPAPTLNMAPITPAPKPALVEPPPEPKAAAVQSEPSPKPNDSEEHAQDPAPVAPEPPPPQPRVMTVPESDSAIAPPSTAPAPKDPGKTSDAAPPTKDLHAQLAAALPSSTSLAMPSSFRAMLSSAGSSSSQEYKGAVYGVLGRIRQVGPAAKRMGMSEGQVGLVLTIAATGAVETIAVMQSSGRADVDAMVIDMVRQAGPFPPPPPGTSRTFTPMISFGEQ